MGYTHYWYVKVGELPQDQFSKVAEDFRVVLKELRKDGLVLAGPDGTGRPEIGPHVIAFNGRARCGHKRDTEIVIPWPTKGAGGIARSSESAKAGGWFGGALVRERTCNGDCSYESFVFERISSEPRDIGHFGSCKTAFRPYDVAVTACLLIARHRFGDPIQVKTDGEDAQWIDAKEVCQSVLGYGLEYEVDDGELKPR